MEVSHVAYKYCALQRSIAHCKEVVHLASVRFKEVLKLANSYSELHRSSARREGVLCVSKKYCTSDRSRIAGPL